MVWKERSGDYDTVPNVDLQQEVLREVQRRQAEVLKELGLAERFYLSLSESDRRRCLPEGIVKVVRSISGELSHYSIAIEATRTDSDPSEWVCDLVASQQGEAMIPSATYEDLQYFIVVEFVHGILEMIAEDMLPDVDDLDFELKIA